jgi:hypothetical protein
MNNLKPEEVPSEFEVIDPTHEPNLIIPKSSKAEEGYDYSDIVYRYMPTDSKSPATALIDIPCMIKLTEDNFKDKYGDYTEEVKLLKDFPIYELLENCIINGVQIILNRSDPMSTIVKEVVWEEFTKQASSENALGCLELIKLVLSGHFNDMKKEPSLVIDGRKITRVKSISYSELASTSLKNSRFIPSIKKSLNRHLYSGNEEGKGKWLRELAVDVNLELVEKGGFLVNSNLSWYTVETGKLNYVTNKKIQIEVIPNKNVVIRHSNYIKSELPEERKAFELSKKLSYWIRVKALRNPFNGSGDGES